MKILCLGDLHFRKKCPTNRTDQDYLMTIIGKMSQALEYARKNNIKIILQPGDWFDSPRVSIEVIGKVCGLLHDYLGISFYCVAGQHDIHFHNFNNPNIPLKILSEAGLLTIIGNSSPIDIGGGVFLYGSSWGQDIPKIKTNGVNILVTHRMVIKSESEKVWDSQEQYDTAENLLKTGFNFIVSGDNHASFVLKNGKNFLINAGSITRSSAAQINHSPCFYVIDVGGKQVKPIKIKINKNLLNTSSKDRKDEIDESLKTFVEGVKTNINVSMDYKASVHKAMEKCSNFPSVNDIIGKIMEQAQI